MRHSLALSLRFLLPAIVLLTGCASQSGFEQSLQQIPLVEPMRPPLKSQVVLARIEEQLPSAMDDENHLAALFYQRGMHYDALGLRWLAQLDFRRALKLRPDLAEAYNRLGIYFVQQQQYDEAFEAFDAVLDLENDHEYAFLNRGIALYYAGRPKLAGADFESFLLKSPKDPYRSLWLYLAEVRMDPETAYARLSYNRTQLDDSEWATQLVDLLLRKLDPNTVIDLASKNSWEGINQAERLCEAYFYIGKYLQLQGEPRKAADLFKLSLSTNIYEFVEHRFSSLELDIFYRESKAARDKAAGS